MTKETRDAILGLSFAAAVCIIVLLLYFLDIYSSKLLMGLAIVFLVMSFSGITYVSTCGSAAITGADEIPVRVGQPVGKPDGVYNPIEEVAYPEM